ncbi:MAG: hypothetical protein A3J62_02745 [Candidatus Buchananbacteria bacterium RIFCSPHIGHO2_02_FULL_38_8]|uniref:Uncharacterized protein n=1 Tax=Candidatus Buchananbacteria bacterium RIFCSPHIGHO2_02_FULL_38_8 TaxID=1797538 RepID=A0A1G1Y6E5_9BACT|nr:MAG: hypothetical protein A3J62_02745 [Candidatus Buchananbacteria bacterium RIFCSPHIGHO2_02_FULL_38_8]
MAIPLAIFYYLYLVFVLVFLIFTLFNIYHLVRFGFLTLGNIAMITFYIIVSILILLISWRYISNINWQQEIQLIPTFPI